MRRVAGGFGITTLMILVLLEGTGAAGPRVGAEGRGRGRQEATAKTPERVPPAVAASIAQRVAELMRERGYPGFSVGIVFENDLIYSQSFGVSDRGTKRPATAETLYQIGSVSKVFTATLLLALRDKGVVRLDDPLPKYLPAGVELPTDRRGAPVITLRHLATHASGLPPDVLNPGRAKDGDPWTGYSAESLRAGLAKTRLEFPTGARWGYSNLGYGLLGMASERADWERAAWAYEALTRQDPPDGFALSRLGLALTHLRKYEQAADAYGRALRLKFRPPQTMYNLACVYSLKGDRDEAVRWLERAISAGFENREALRTDPDLNNLREDPRFIRLLERR
jgi:hypothetical protein